MTEERPIVPVLFRRLDPEAPEPAYAHAGDAGADLTTVEDVDLAPGRRRTVGTGIAVALPDGFAAFVQPRSGLAARHGLTVLNAPGTVDAGYRGEIRVTLLNTDTDHTVHLRRGDRIAQLVVQPVVRARFLAAETLPGSQRGEAGFGSSGGWTPDVETPQADGVAPAPEADGVAPAPEAATSDADGATPAGGTPTDGSPAPDFIHEPDETNEGAST